MSHFSTDACGGFLCDDGHCIHASYKCDDQPDCGDNSDEADCIGECGDCMCTWVIVVKLACVCEV